MIQMKKNKLILPAVKHNTGAFLSQKHQLLISRLFETTNQPGLKHLGIGWWIFCSREAEHSNNAAIMFNARP